MVLRRYRTTACHSCAIKNSCTKGKERLISRWEHEHILEAVQRRLDEHPEKMRQRRETIVSIRKINAHRHFDDLVSRLPWAVLHNQDPNRKSRPVRRTRRRRARAVRSAIFAQRDPADSGAAPRFLKAILAFQFQCSYVATVRVSHDGERNEKHGLEICGHCHLDSVCTFRAC